MYPFWRYSLFSILIVAVSIITLVTLLFKGGRRLKFSELDKQMKGKSSKEKKASYLIQSEESGEEED